MSFGLSSHRSAAKENSGWAESSPKRPSPTDSTGISPFNSEIEGEDDFEPLLGYVILEQAQAAVDMFGHRLVPVPYIDMK